MVKRIVFITCAAALLSIAEARDHERVIRCESEGGRSSYCETGAYGDVQLRRQLSKRRCEEYDTWGADRDGSGIWVRDGCRAEFTVREVRGWGRWRHDRDRDDDDDRDRDDRYGDDDRYDRDEVSRVHCSSVDWSYAECPVRGRPSDARIVRQISKTRCERGDNWDLDRRKIWVDRGCEAVFEVR